MAYQRLTEDEIDLCLEASLRHIIDLVKVVAALLFSSRSY